MTAERTCERRRAFSGLAKGVRPLVGPHTGDQCACG